MLIYTPLLHVRTKVNYCNSIRVSFFFSFSPLFRSEVNSYWSVPPLCTVIYLIWMESRGSQIGADAWNNFIMQFTISWYHWSEICKSPSSWQVAATDSNHWGRLSKNLLYSDQRCLEFNLPIKCERILRKRNEHRSINFLAARRILTWYNSYYWVRLNLVIFWWSKRWSSGHFFWYLMYFSLLEI